jgi:hypothetical protein
MSKSHGLAPPPPPPPDYQNGQGPCRDTSAPAHPQCPLPPLVLIDPMLCYEQRRQPEAQWNGARQRRRFRHGAYAPQAACVQRKVWATCSSAASLVIWPLMGTGCTHKQATHWPKSMDQGAGQAAPTAPSSAKHSASSFTGMSPYRVMMGSEMRWRSARKAIG